MKKLLLVTVFFVAFFSSLSAGLGIIWVKAAVPSASPQASPTAAPAPKPDLTKESPVTATHLEKILESQKITSVWPLNPVKAAIRNAISAGVPANTIVLLLLLPLVALVIAAARNLLGIRGFGIFLPAALSVVFVATGPVLGIGLFLLIVFVSTIARVILRKLKVELQYLPRMALFLWIVSLAVLGLLFLAPLIHQPKLTGVSIFPVLVMTLLVEDFIRVQLGKSIKTAINLTTETLILALVSFVVLTLSPVQAFALLHPEALLISVVVFDFILGKYAGLRFLEFWRFRQLISS